MMVKYLYKDSEDRLIATNILPAIINELAVLKAVDVNKTGLF